MTLYQIRLIRDSFAELVPIGDTVAELFYRRLFAIDPAWPRCSSPPTARRRAVI